MDKNTLLNISKNMQDLTFVLAKKNYDKIGALSNVDQNTVVYKKTMYGMELSFDVYKELDGIQEKLWYELTDFKLVWLKEINEYFQIIVSTDELSYTKKTVTATSLCEAELSQVNLYNIEINTEDDIARDDYKITTFYNMDDPESSLIHRILSKVPQYTIKHVDSSLSKIQRSFSVDGTSILDFLNGDCAEQFNCLFTFDSTDRSVSVYDLYAVCEDCGERDDMSNFTHIDENGSLIYTCPKCGSHNVKYYGEDTKIFVDNENLTDEVQLETDTDSVKNCFKLVAGDDLMTATVQLLNMNGSDYIYYVSDEQKKDMPKELVDKIESYDKLCASYNTEYESLVSQIYEASTKLYYYRNSMMPTIEHATVTAATEAAKLTAQNLSPLGLSSVSTSTSKATVESALKNYAKVYVKSGYAKLEINDSSFSYGGTDSSGNHYGTWTGKFKVTNYSDETDIAYSSTISVKVYDNYQDFIEQKIKKTILNDANDDDSIFDVLNINNLDNFKEALTYYCLNRLKSFYDAVQSALDVLVQMNQGVKGAIVYDSLYVPYYNKLQACQAEIDKRQVTVNEWQTKYDNAVSRQQEIQKILNFEDYIGANLYKLFCCYRREDTYQNDNYISDGLEDQEVIERAKEFLEVAKKELVKSSTMQHSISTTLYNLLCIPEFKPILNSFEVGNWIRVRVDGNIYKLRLIQYEISFSNMNTISVEFSDVTKIRDSLTDFQSLVKDTQSMSSNYSYISKQADAGHKASVNMDKIVEDGLNSALVNIKNNDREEITYDNHGIRCREYDDISDDYSDEQLIITHNILGYTDDGMKSVKASLGKHEYTYYDGNTFVKDVSYGLSCEFVQSGYIYGSQIISGDIYSSNYSPTAGSHINLRNGSFSFAGGKFSYDSKSNNMILKGVTIKWDSSTPPEITDINGLNEQLSAIDDYLDQLDGRIQSFSQTTDPSTDWTTVSLKEQHIGDLWFNPNNGLTKRWTGSSWETITDSILDSLAKSKAQVFTAKPTVAYFKGDMLIPVETFTFNGVTYTKERAYRALKNSNGITFNNSDWDELDYTNDDTIVAFINGDYKKALESINTQIDGKADTFYQSTKPHVEYTNIASNSTYDLYVGDLWYDTSTGKSYMYNKVANGSNYNYIWQQMDVPDEVYDKIDGKAQIFTSQPKPPYNKGDLWFNGSSDDIMTCITTRSSGSYVSSDWEKRNKYTDMKAVEDKGYQTASQVTTITENTIKTSNLIAENLHVNSANIDGKLTASQIDTTNLNVASAATISGTLSAEKISGGLLKGVRAVITDGANSMRVIYNNDYYMMFRAGGISIHHKYPGNIEQWFKSDNSIGIGLLSDTNGWEGDENVSTGDLNENNATTHSRAEIFFEKGSNSSGSNDYIQFRCQNRPHWYKKENGNISYFDKGEIALKSDIPTDYVKDSHTHRITPTQGTISEGSGTHNFIYYFRTEPGTNGFTYQYNYVSGSFSDVRLKENIRPIEDISDKYMRLEPIQFNFHDDINCVFKGTHFGFIAQDVVQIFNDNRLAIVCREHQENESINKYLCGDDAYVLDKDELHALHVQMIQKHQREIDKLTQQNISLEGRISILEQIVNQLTSQLNQFNN